MFKWPSQVKIVVDDVYEKAVYDKFWDVQQGFNVLDVGAYIGVYTLKTAKKTGFGGRVISVEPEGENFRFLLKNIKLNGFDNITPVRGALSDFEGVGSLFLSAYGSGEHSMLLRSQKKLKIPVHTVDGLMRKLRIDSLDIMKIDVEGTEIQVLKGSNQMLKERRIRRVVVAAYHYPDECSEVSNLLRAFNYTIVVDECYVYATLSSCEEFSEFSRRSMSKKRLSMYGEDKAVLDLGRVHITKGIGISRTDLCGQTKNLCVNESLSSVKAC
jgi:FkbM family methyltransferase